MKFRQWTLPVGLLALGVALGAGGAWWLRTPSAVPNLTKSQRPSPNNSSDQRHILYWASPMNPKIHSNHPMKDNMGMAYTPVYAPGTNAQKPSGLHINSQMAQNLGVRLVQVQERQMGHSIHTVGTVAVDENRVYSVNPRFSGWVEQLRVRAVGDTVQRGQVLAEIYSPALYSAQQEYLIARRQQGRTADPALLAAAQTKLQLLGMSRNEITALALHGHAERDVALRAPASGVIETLNVHQGSYIAPQTELYQIANLDRVWVNVALYTYQLPWIHTGDSARLHLPAYPEVRWKGSLSFLYPTLNAQNRTVTARLSVPNPEGKLRPGTYADATILARPEKSLAVPSSAVLHGSQGDFVMLGEGHGHFLPVQVRLGPAYRGWVAIPKGLRPGDRVVESAQFLLYSESQFQSVRARMLGANTARVDSASPVVAKNRSTPVSKKPKKSTPASMANMNMGGKSHD
ncbi:efflux RND transporter periplasmic adaptor subunit [Acidithiobacillus sp. HP-2]|uniref:efflux RND transporter periplasmic adaptor subunit n=1 Tax=Acidithiobacillus sp. HP-2 TaxID=2697654 RepID=UPI00187ADC8F|nr:efflux RND transporter periplasmic adaptor subunit [Acidithiobacillus sp. HP-2]MBE7569474.1 efflux RND transporter periplasmic adaptor subunit [Acidithiobacillus sp. HP-2]